MDVGLRDGLRVAGLDIPGIEPSKDQLIVVNFLPLVLGGGPATALGGLGDAPVDLAWALARAAVVGSYGAALFEVLHLRL